MKNRIDPEWVGHEHDHDKWKRQESKPTRTITERFSEIEIDNYNRIPQHQIIVFLNQIFEPNVLQTTNPFMMRPLSGGTNFCLIMNYTCVIYLNISYAKKVSSYFWMKIVWAWTTFPKNVHDFVVLNLNKYVFQKSCRNSYAIMF